MMKALSTRYRGFDFRSRLEARWAVFYDALRIRWEYEPQLFDLDEAGRYLPDFRMPDLGLWVEIKADFPNDEERRKALYLAALTKEPVFVFFGECWIPSEASFSGAVAFLPREDGIPDEDQDGAYYWCECPECGAFGITWGGFADRLTCCFAYQGGRMRLPACETPFIVRAYERSRAERFGADYELRDALRAGKGS